MREVCKLFLNSLSGKLVENPASYSHIKCVEDNTDHINVVKNKEKINNIDIIHQFSNSINPYLALGVCMYSHSKINLFKSVDIVGAENVLNAETDSIFIKSKYLPLIEKQDFYGEKLGQIGLEAKSSEAVFVDKKTYWFSDDKNAFKGVPKQTIDESGKKYKLYNRQTFVDKHNGKHLIMKYSTIKKNLFGDVSLSSGFVTREFNK